MKQIKTETQFGRLRQGADFDCLLHDVTSRVEENKRVRWTLPSGNGLVVELVTDASHAKGVEQ